MPEPGLSHWDKPLGQAQPVPVGQADWDKHSLSQMGKGQKRPLLVPWDKSYTHAGGLSLSRDKLYSSLYPRWSLSQFHVSQLVPQSGSTRPCNFESSKKSAGMNQFGSSTTTWRRGSDLYEKCSLVQLSSGSISCASICM